MPTPPAPAPASNYRPEINGLRAFAVTAVIANHFNKAILPSGHLGVDVFFVISGFVITLSLARRNPKSFIDFISDFYTRRIKRLVPALAAFVLATSIVICLVDPSPGPALGTGWRSLIGISNIQLYKGSTDYFSKSAELNPFTHTWSLGVEEQFYLLFPLLAWISGFARNTAKGTKNLTVIMILLAASSAIYFGLMYQTNQSVAFFSMPSRCWELAAGCLTYIKLQEHKTKRKSTFPCMIILFLMAVLMCSPKSGAIGSLAITILTSVLLIGISEDTPTHRILTNRSVMYIGLISYSLYLWHWGVLCISRWTLGIHWWSAPFQLALILLLASSSFHWIESPLRNTHFKTRSQAFAVGASVILALVLTLRIGLKANSKQFYLGDRTFQGDRFEDRFKHGKITAENCFDFNNVSTAINNCIENYNTKRLTSPSYWLLGDSHAMTLLEGFRKLSRENHRVLRAITSSATIFPQPIGIESLGPFPGMSERIKLHHRLQESLLSHVHTGDIVFLAHRFPFHFGPDLYEYQQDAFSYRNKRSLIRFDKRSYFISWLNSVGEFASKMSNRGVRIVILGPTPEWEDAIYHDCTGQKGQWFQAMRGHECSSSKEDWKSLYKYYIGRLQIVAAKHSNISILDSLDIVCPNNKCEFADDSGKALFWDDDHLSDYASTYFMEPAIKKLLEELPSDSQLNQ